MTHHPTLRDLMEEAARAYAHPARPSKETCHQTLLAVAHWENARRAAAGMPRLPLPTRRELERTIADMDPFEAYAARYGVDAARRRFLVQGGRS